MVVNINADGQPAAQLSEVSFSNGDWYITTAHYCKEHDRLFLGDSKTQSLIVVTGQDGSYNEWTAAKLPYDDIQKLGERDFPSDVFELNEDTVLVTTFFGHVYRYSIESKEFSFLHESLNDPQDVTMIAYPRSANMVDDMLLVPYWINQNVELWIFDTRANAKNVLFRTVQFGQTSDKLKD